ncbi:hypothetical protein [Mucilaginibacter pedocola]|uniref:Uncharacterized protein n=1 Tax=Mucilaginibacter pedocola TaxID=1792845 RepID=A0A1S9PEV9_9SPHI|nr:hypothetical protein [Mucilaginibacter pedocola]OOQ59482.1 hypothetical protein BC343_04690 [Mucilaginibacter pedocola]
MANSIQKLSLYTEKYKEIIDLLALPIDANKLPIVGECKIFKSSAERYGHVIIKLDLETDENLVKGASAGHYTYEWMPEKTFAGRDNVIVPLDKAFEADILNELSFFTTLLGMFDKSTQYLRFSVIGGSYRITERPYFAAATAQALIQIMRKLNDS